MASENNQDKLDEEEIENENAAADEETAQAEPTNDQTKESATDSSGEELTAMKDKYLRLFAEFDNYKKRTAREFVEMRQTAGKDVISSLLDVLDDMDRAEEQFEKTDDNASLKEGTLLIFNKLRKILESKGLKSMDTLHTDFDVEKDEAVSEVPVEDEKLKGKVIAEVQKGYLLNDKIIRFAKVVVGK